MFGLVVDERGYVNPAVAAGMRRNDAVLEFGVGDDRLSVGVHVGTGALQLEQTALVLPGVVDPLVLGAVYGSNTVGEGASYQDETSHGAGWSTLLGGDVRLVEQDDGSVSYIGRGGQVSLFVPDGNGGYTEPSESRAELEAVASGWELSWHESGGVEVFDGLGRMVEVADRNDNVVTIGYDGASRRMTTITGTGGPAGSRQVTVDYGPFSMDEGAWEVRAQ